MQWYHGPSKVKTLIQKFESRKSPSVTSRCGACHFNPTGWHIQLHTLNFFFAMFSPSGQKLVDIIHFLKCFRWTSPFFDHFWGCFFLLTGSKGLELVDWKSKACFSPSIFLGILRGSKKTQTAWLQLGCPISLRSSEQTLGKTRSFTVEMFFCDQYWDTVIDGSEILNNHQGCMKPCKWWDKLPASTGTGFFIYH